MAAAATIKMESPGGSGATESPAAGGQDQPDASLPGDSSPSGHGHGHGHRHGRPGWWGRQWRPTAPPAELPQNPETATETPEATQQQEMDGQSVGTSEQTDHPGRRQHGGPRFWHRDWRAKAGEVTGADGQSHDYGSFAPYGMSGYRGYRYPCFRRRMFQDGPENTHIFREFDF